MKARTVGLRGVSCRELKIGMSESAATTSIVQDAQQAEAAVHRAAAKVDELDARVRAELEEEGAGAAQAEDDEEDDEEEDDDDEDEPDAKKQKRAPKKDLLAMYGSHEKVLTHYMQLSNGFVVEDHESMDPPVQLVVPKCGVEKMKSFRARFGRHLRAIGFVPNTPEEAIKQGRLHKPEYLEIAWKLDDNVWLRVYTTDPKRAFAQRKLDPHTLLEAPPPDAIDPVLLEDPLADA